MSLQVHRIASFLGDGLGSPGVAERVLCCTFVNTRIQRVTICTYTCLYISVFGVLGGVDRETEGTQEKDHCAETITFMLILAALATGGLPEINLSNVS